MEGLSDGGERSRPVSILAAVTDAGFASAGNFDKARVGAIARRLEPYKIELWVPQEVIWEWAVHAHELWPKISRDYGRLVAGGFAAAKPAADKDDSVELVTKVLEATANVVILPTHGESAIQAIRDQVMQTGPGAKKSGVRTGAVDSAWIRDAIAHTPDNDPGHLIFLSENKKDVLKTTQSIGCPDEDVRIATSEKELFDDHIEALVVAPMEATRRLSYRVSRLAAQARREQREDFHDVVPPWIYSDEIDYDYSIRVRSPDLDELEHRDSVEIGQPQPVPVSVSDVRVDATGASEEWPRSVSFTLRILGGLDVHGYSINGDGHVNFETVHLPNVLFTVPCVVDELALNQFGVLRPTAPAEATSAIDLYDDEIDAFAGFLGELEGLEGVTLREDVGSLEPTTGTTFTVEGPGTRHDTAEVWMSPDSEAVWRIEFQESGVVIECTYDPDSRAWQGLKDSVDIFPLCSVHAEGSAEPYSAIGKLWFYLVGQPEPPRPEPPRPVKKTRTRK